MLRCANCGRDVPEVLGAPTQACPHCGLEVASAATAEARLHGTVDAAAAAAEAFRFAKRHYGGALLIWFPSLVADVAGVLAVGGYEGSHPLPAPGSSNALSGGLGYLGVALPVLLLLTALKLALFAPTAAFVLDRSGASSEGGGALGWAVRAPFALLGMGLALLLLYVGGALLALVGLVVFYHWYQFVPVAWAQRRRGLADAFEASCAFARERRVFGFTALSFFVFLGAYIVQAALSVAGLAGLRAIGFDNLWTEAIVGDVPVWLVVPFLAILPAAFWSLGLRAPATPPVAADASARERFRTTKCPACGTLIPYEATGQAVDVTCPSCGRHGSSFEEAPARS